MADENSEVFVASREKAHNGYGQNGFAGPSSDLPGQHTTSGFLPQTSVPSDKWQTRDVSKEQYAPSFGMKSPGEPAKVPASTTRRAGAGKQNSSFQRR